MTDTKPVSFIITNSTITVSLEGRTHMVSRNDSSANKLIAALREKRWSEVPVLVSVAKQIETYTEGNFKVMDGEVLVDDQVVHGLLATKIREFADQGLPYMPLVWFARNVRKNPNKRAVSDLYDFLDVNKHPITDDGCFIAYRKVRRGEDGVLRDIHTGTMDNSVGQVVEMPRSEVNDNPEKTCERGLHACSWSYFGVGALSSSSRDVYIEVKISPKDTVAFPRDYGLAKLRTAKFEVLSIIDKPLQCSYRDTHSVESEETEGLCEMCGTPITAFGECECDAN